MKQELELKLSTPSYANNLYKSMWSCLKIFFTKIIQLINQDLPAKRKQTYDIDMKDQSNYPYKSSCSYE